MSDIIHFPGANNVVVWLPAKMNVHTKLQLDNNFLVQHTTLHMETLRQDASSSQTTRNIGNITSQYLGHAMSVFQFDHGMLAKTRARERERVKLIDVDKSSEGLE